MAWCPKCRKEYPEGVTECADCNEPLVEALPDEPDTARREKRRLTRGCGADRKPHRGLCSGAAHDGGNDPGCTERQRDRG